MAKKLTLLLITIAALLMTLSPCFSEAELQKKEVVSQKEAPAVKEQKPSLQADSSAEYIIGPEDALFISVWQSPELDKEVIVPPDGKISLPLVGELKITGLTISQFNRQVTERIKEYIRQPEVIITIRKIGGKKVMVLGEVKSPGVYAVTGAKSIIEAIALAGGLTRDSVPSSTVLIRGGFGNPSAKRINLSRVFQGDLSQNVRLESEDIVFVPKKFIADLNYFLGQILDPLSKGAYTYKELQSW